MFGAAAQILPGMLQKRVVGVVGRLPYDPLEYCILAASTAIAWAFCVELNFVIFYTFRRRSGLYFWSLIISSWGCIFHALGFILKFLTLTPPGGFLPFIEIGWTAMVTGQSFVLYSRLHLVVRKRLTLRLVLAMIIWNVITLHIPTIVLTIGSNGPNGAHWAPVFNVMERIQLAIFCVQEFIISTVYIYYTVKLLGSIYHSKTRTVMFQLILINGLCLGMDVILIGLEYSNNYVGETSIKGMLYSIKLKLEFAVLNQLVSLTRAGFTEERLQRFEDPNQPHELRNRTARSSAEEGMFPSRTTRIFRGSISKNVRRPSQSQQMNRIFQTQQVDVISEPKSKFQVCSSQPRDASEFSPLPPSPFDNTHSPPPLFALTYPTPSKASKAPSVSDQNQLQESCSPSTKSDESF